MNRPTNSQAASIYIPHIQEWISITGACLVDGKFLLTWKSNKKSGTLDLDTAQELAKNYAVPF